MKSNEVDKSHNVVENEPEKRKIYIRPWTPDTRREYIRKNLTGIMLKVNIVGGIAIAIFFLLMFVATKLGYLE